MTDRCNRVAGYVKLAKLWERAAEQAIEYHHSYYADKFDGNDSMVLIGVYIDITGQKQIYNRPEMLRLLRDCRLGRIDCIATQTKGYLAANSRDLCYLLKMLFDMPGRIDIITEDVTYRINTIADIENQREALLKMAKDYIDLDTNAYEVWKQKVEQGIEKLIED